MALSEFIAPDENIKYSHPEPVDFMGEKYDFHLTNKRMIWHKTEGLIFKKDRMVAEVLEKVTTIQFKEEGLFFKKGTVSVVMGSRKEEFSGNSKSIKALYREVQTLMNL